MIPVRRALGALLAPVLLVLPACGQSTQAFPDPPPTTPASTIASPPQPPKRETAEHFIRRWADEDKRMQNTGDVGSYMEMSRQCDACDALANLVTKYYAAGGYIRWQGRRITSIRPYPAPRGHVAFAMRSISAPTTYRKSSADPTEKLDGGPITYVLTMVRTRTSFLMTARAQLSE